MRKNLLKFITEIDDLVTFKGKKYNPYDPGFSKYYEDLNDIVSSYNKKSKEKLDIREIEIDKKSKHLNCFLNNNIDDKILKDVCTKHNTEVDKDNSKLTIKGVK